MGSGAVVLDYGQQCGGIQAAARLKRITVSETYYLNILVILDIYGYGSGYFVESGLQNQYGFALSNLCL